MTKYVIGSAGWALVITDKPLEGFDVYRKLTDQQSERLKSRLPQNQRIHYSQLDKLLE